MASALTVFEAGLALKTQGSLVNGLMPFFAGVAGFFFNFKSPPHMPSCWHHLKVPFKASFSFFMARALMVFETPVLTSTNMLRLVRGCPLIVDVSWYQEDGDSSATEEDNCNAINRLLKSRGGKEMAGYHRRGGNY